MHALFVRLNVPPEGVDDETVYLFDTELAACEFAWGVLCDAGLVAEQNGRFGDWHDGELEEWPGVRSRIEAVAFWADTRSIDEYFHVYEVIDKRENRNA